MRRHDARAPRRGRPPALRRVFSQFGARTGASRFLTSPAEARPRRDEGEALVRCPLPLQPMLQHKPVAFLPARRKVEVEAMGNKTLAVDASIWIYHVSKP